LTDTGAKPVTIEGLLATREIVITCGAGGVGKTTTAASLAVMAAIHQGGKVLVLTVDPARRLADALGVGRLSNSETRVGDDALSALGVAPRGQLWAAMLDTKQSWDNLVRLHAPDRATAGRIIENPLYHNITERFVQAHDYIAMERLYELHSEGKFDLIVVDTPPTRNALDFIEAPERMAEFFSSRLLRLLIVPYRSRLVNLASRPFYQVADRILGSQFLEDIAEFFLLFQTMYDGFVERARAVSRLLRDRRSTFVVVSTMESLPIREAEHFIGVIRSKGFDLGALILNKALPAYLGDESLGEAAQRLVSAQSDVAAELATRMGVEPAPLQSVLREVAENFRNLRVVARREAKLAADLAVGPVLVVRVPELQSDVSDLSGLYQLGRHLWG
jgi:anion-transporting  ArsA/GET3 family ATPase